MRGTNAERCPYVQLIELYALEFMGLPNSNDRTLLTI